MERLWEGYRELLATAPLLIPKLWYWDNGAKPYLITHPYGTAITFETPAEQLLTVVVDVAGTLSTMASIGVSTDIRQALCTDARPMANWPGLAWPSCPAGHASSFLISFSLGPIVHRKRVGVEQGQKAKLVQTWLVADAGAMQKLMTMHPHSLRPVRCCSWSLGFETSKATLQNGL